MNMKRVFSRTVALTLRHSKMFGAGAAAVAAAMLAPVAGAQSIQPPTTALFAVYSDALGSLTTNSTDPSTLNTSNPFFDPTIGTNGQACVTCHEPSTGITITVPFIQKAFNTSGGTDPLFRPNDTANNPHTNSMSTNPADYSLILNLGVVRIGKTVPSGADFTVVAADATTNDMFAAPDVFPLMTDPQHPGTPTLSVFRRPLVNTNVNFDSAVLWDGRESIDNMPLQVDHAIETLLLGPSPTAPLASVDQSIADFMTGVFTDQKATDLAGELTAVGATGGVANLLALSQSASRPCVDDAAGNLTPFVAAVATTSSCTPVKVGAAPFSMFDSWLNLPNNPGNAERLSVARGEQIFNGKVGKANCRFCHTVPNMGNNNSAAVFKADGTDSPMVMNQVLTAAQATGTSQEIQMVQDMINNINQLPLYCLRPVTTQSTSACGTVAGDVVTTDPGHALVSGHIADASNVGAVTGGVNGASFKPPILRDLAVRAPFFHAGVAVDMQHLVNFYNFRFSLGLTTAQEADLVNFLNAL